VSRNLESIRPFFIVKDLQAGTPMFTLLIRTRSSRSSGSAMCSFVTPLSFIDDGLWGFEIADADGYVIAFFQLRDK